MNMTETNYELTTEQERMFEDMLRQWAECNSVCDVAVPRERKKEGLEKADRYMKILPGADYVLTQTLNYIFSNGLTTGSINEDKTLDDFLYRKNDRGNTNLSELRNTIGMAITHGGSGLRWDKGNVYQYKWGTFRVLTYTEDGIEKILGYVVAEDGGRVPYFDFDFSDMQEYEDFLRRLKEQKMILLTDDEFIVMRNDTSEWYGSSPLLADEERLDLLVAVYERLNYDIKYDGPGRIIIRPKDGYVQGEENEVSSATVMAGALEGNEKRVELLKKEAARVAGDLKQSSSDSVIVLSNAWSENIEHLERVTKATEFFEWIENDTLVLAQDFGMSPSLLELGGISGNVSMTSIISVAMNNSIVPLREKYATQFSSFLSKQLGVEKIYFDKYEMEQREDENTMRTKIVNIMSLLNAMKDENDNIRQDALDLFRDFAEMLSQNIHNENGQLEELKVGITGK